MTQQSNRAGGIAGLVEALTFVIGIVLYSSLLLDYTTGDPTPAESVAFLAEHQTAFYLWNVVIYLVFGVALVVLALSVHRLLDQVAPTLAPVATAFGLIWAGLVLATGMVANIGAGVVVDLSRTDPAQAEPVWSALDAVQNGLGGGNELVGGVWVLLVSVVGLRHRLLGTGLHVLGLVIGAAGVLTVVPPLQFLSAVFGLGLIVWFTWLGVLLLRTARRPGEADATRPPATAATPHT